MEMENGYLCSPIYIYLFNGINALQERMHSTMAAPQYSGCNKPIYIPNVFKTHIQFSLLYVASNDRAEDLKPKINPASNCTYKHLLGFTIRSKITNIHRRYIRIWKPMSIGQDVS